MLLRYIAVFLMVQQTHRKVIPLSGLTTVLISVRKMILLYILTDNTVTVLISVVVAPAGLLVVTLLIVLLLSIALYRSRKSK